MNKQDQNKSEKSGMWCCVWGCCSPGDNVPSPESETETEKTKTAAEAPKEFVVTGNAASELKISYISPSEHHVFAQEVSHQLPSMGIHNVALSADGDLIAAVSLDGTLMLLHVSKGVRLPNVTHNLTANFWSTAFGGNSGDCVFAGSGNGQVYKYDTKLGKLQHTYDTRRLENVLGLAISADGRWIAASDYEGYLTIFDAETGKVLMQSHYLKPMRRLCFDPLLSHLLAACDDGMVKLIAMPSGRLRENLSGHESLVMSVDASPDGQRFVSGACDGCVKVWDLRYMKCEITFMSNSNSNLWDVAFNRLNDKVACAGDGRGITLFYC